MPVARNSTVPVGTKFSYGGTTAPQGFLLCDGSAISRTVYAKLFQVLGESCGAGDGSTTFNLPDLRGRFERMVDGAAGRDPDAATRTAMGTGGNAGNQVGSVQADALRAHDHNLSQNLENNNNGGPFDDWGAIVTTGGNRTVPVTPAGGAETRPVNAYTNFIIKF